MKIADMEIADMKIADMKIADKEITDKGIADKRGAYKEIKLIAVDMDGTLVDDEKRIPEENLRALEACAAKGIEIVPATGRTVQGVPKELKALPGVRYGITVNGAVVADLKENRVISSCRLPAGLAVQVMTMARDCGDDVMYDAYVDGVGYTSERFYGRFPQFIQSEALVRLLMSARQAVPDHIAWIQENASYVDKINMFFRDQDARERMRERLGQMPELLVSSSLSCNLEINAAGADKGGALIRLADFLGIARESTMAFGDGENDLSMIRQAGLGVAMANGVPAVKEAAEYVTLSNEEAGVAAAIRRFVLK